PRIVVAVRGLGRMFNEQRGWRGRAPGWLMHVLYYLSFSAAHTVWFTSESDLSYMVEHRLVERDRSFLTTNSVDADHFSIEQVSEGQCARVRADLGLADEKVVVMVARVLWMKGIGEFVEAA